MAVCTSQRVIRGQTRGVARACPRGTRACPLDHTGAVDCSYKKSLDKDTTGLQSKKIHTSWFAHVIPAREMPKSNYS
ncbi:hypothetical protein EPI10_023394 [Gossypium australe]|uniref:Uncharacterized protein n=1 Tax=Gossypium australe TaxID=47621 RepID=A0A5B6VU36_9ROSI|nr:hypothetical protein EPI10_023394 [Gossypium australe]